MPFLLQTRAGTPRPGRRGLIRLTKMLPFSYADHGNSQSVREINLKVRRGTMNPYRRAILYFAPDRLRIVAMLVLIGLSVCVGLLEAWPIAILIDGVLSS